MAIETSLRQVSLILLKNHLKGNTPGPSQTLSIRPRITQALKDSCAPIRQVAAGCVSQMIGAQGLNSWPELLGTLMQWLTHSTDPLEREGALGKEKKS